MEISQKKFSNRTQFSFDKESLKHTVKDKCGSHSFTVEYGSISTDSAEIEERSIWYRNVGALWVLLGAFLILSRYLAVGELKGSIWLILGLVCLSVYRAAKTSYTVIPTENGHIFVIKNAQHDEIMNEIDTRRKAQWYSWHAPLNLDNDPLIEMNKYKWLLLRDVISQAEYNENIMKIAAHHNIDLFTSQADHSEQTIN